MQQNTVSIQFPASQSYSVSGCWCSIPWWSISFCWIFHSSLVPVFSLGERHWRRVGHTKDRKPNLYSISTSVEKLIPWQIPWSLWGNRKAQKPLCQIAHWQICISSSSEAQSQKELKRLEKEDIIEKLQVQQNGYQARQNKKQKHLKSDSALKCEM